MEGSIIPDPKAIITKSRYKLRSACESLSRTLIGPIRSWLGTKKEKKSTKREKSDLKFYPFLSTLNNLSVL